LFGGIVKINVRLGIELTVLIIGSLMSICFVKRIPLGRIDIEFEESTAEASQSQSPSPGQNETTID